MNVTDLLLRIPARALHPAARIARCLQQRLGLTSDADRIAAAFDQIMPADTELDADQVNAAINDWMRDGHAHYTLINPQQAEDEAELHWSGDETGFDDPGPINTAPPILLDPADPNTRTIRKALDEAQFIEKHRTNHTTSPTRPTRTERD